MEAKITFANGSELTAEMSGNCFIVNEKPDFPEDLSEVTVESGEGEKVYQNVIVQECAHVDDKYWFAFVEEDPRDVEIRMLEDAIIELAEIIGG